jgi:hypothetical protein
MILIHNCMNNIYLEYDQKEIMKKYIINYVKYKHDIFTINLLKKTEKYKNVLLENTILIPDIINIISEYTQNIIDVKLCIYDCYNYANKYNISMNVRVENLFECIINITISSNSESDIRKTTYLCAINNSIWNTCGHAKLDYTNGLKKIINHTNFLKNNNKCQILKKHNLEKIYNTCNLFELTHFFNKYMEIEHNISKYISSDQYNCDYHEDYKIYIVKYYEYIYNNKIKIIHVFNHKKMVQIINITKLITTELQEICKSKKDFIIH